MCYFTVEEIKRANKEAGKHFFNPSTMRFFRSRVLPGVYGCRYFVTSEQFDVGHPRLYTVRVVNPDGSIDDASEFQEFKTSKAARNAARALARDSG